MPLNHWIPIIRYKFTCDLPLGISIYIGHRERALMTDDPDCGKPTRCVCCGGHIVSNVIGPVFEWSCTEGNEKLGCKYHYDLLEVPCPPEECPLQTNPHIQRQRHLYHWYIRRQIRAIIQKHGYCVTKGPHDEVEISLKKWREKKLIKIFVYDLLWIIYFVKK